MNSIRKTKLPEACYRYVKESMDACFSKDCRIDLEKGMAAVAGTNASVAVATGAAALHVILQALEVQPGDEILVSGLTDYGSWTGALWETGNIKFVDTDPLTGNVTAELLEQAASSKSKVFILTHLYGLPADLDGIMEVCKKHDILLVEDCCQSMGATYKGKPTGCFGVASAFSFARAKHVTCDGGGMICTSDPAIEKRCRTLAIDRGAELTNLDGSMQYLIKHPGTNYRLPTVLMGLVLGQLECFDDDLKRELGVMRHWTKVLNEDSQDVAIPVLGNDQDGCDHSAWLLPLSIPAAQDDFSFALKVRDALTEHGVPGAARLQYYGPYHSVVGPCDALPGAEKHIRSTVQIPWFEQYENSDVEKVLNALRELKG